MGLKITTRKATISRSERYIEIIALKATLDAEMKDLRATLDAEMEGFTGLQAGNVTIIKQPRTRKSLNKDLVVALFGQAALEQCQKVTSYFQWQVVNTESLSA